ncbi:MAG: AAA family ATPase [Chitinophagaceae bacterium]|nr:AAA family ATPase [Chitinophagaceae bacterium]
MKKAVITGPESTGKSTLCRQLANHYKTLWVPEFAREFLLKNGNKYSYEDLLNIARGQLRLEDEYLQALSHTTDKKKSDQSELPSILFVDTDMYVMKVWCEFVFGKCHPWILEQIAKREYDYYLLCNIDLPWIQDELREYPMLETRQQLFKIYKDILVNQSTPWTLISGDDKERLNNAVRVIDNYLIC